jgi:hypothetical protein
MSVFQIHSQRHFQNVNSYTSGTETLSQVPRIHRNITTEAVSLVILFTMSAYYGVLSLLRTGRNNPAFFLSVRTPMSRKCLAILLEITYLEFCIYSICCDHSLTSSWHFSN